MMRLQETKKRHSAAGTFILLGISMGLLVMVGWSVARMDVPLGQLPTQHYLDTTRQASYFTLANLAEASLRTTTRLFIGLLWSLLFSIIFGVLAARCRPARQVILPLVNLLESVPLLGFLTFTTAWFMGLFPNNVLGVEAVAIFGVFTAQAWNIMLSLYQSLRVTPHELLEVTDQFGCNRWQRFWRLELPYATPGILWNVVISQSAAWFALVACEQASVAVPRTETLILPGIGSYLQIALDRSNFGAVLSAVAAMVVCVLVVNVLIFQPLIKATANYKYGTSSAESFSPQSAIYDLLKGAKLPNDCQRVGRSIRIWWLFTLPQTWIMQQITRIIQRLKRLATLWTILWYGILAGLITWLAVFLAGYLDWPKWQILLDWTLLTTGRVVLAVMMSAVIFIPLAIWVASTPTRLSRIQPIGQVVGSIPSDVYVPIVVVIIAVTGSSHQWWVLPLIMTGTQWYFFFNVIAGYLAIPNDIHEVTHVFHLTGWRWWTQFLIPSIFPYLITAIINAAGAAWNADIAAELITWGTKTYALSGLGAYVAKNVDNKPAEATGVLIICGMVGLCVIFVWQPLYRFAERRFHY